MDNISIASKAIESTIGAERAYCKFLSANDSGETGGHQAGILISKKAIAMLFDKSIKELAHIEKRQVIINWQDELETESTFTYYTSKGELRITGFGRNFPFLNKEDTGNLFVFTEQDREHYSGYFLNTEDDINTYLDAFNISPTETNDIIEKNEIVRGPYTQRDLELRTIEEYIESITLGNIIHFPDSYTMSRVAREIENNVYNHREYAIIKPDDKIISYTDQEYRLFRLIEYHAYKDIVGNGFRDMDDFVEVANQVLNRRKSRAGKSLEHHIASIFDANRIEYEEQVITEGNKKPDFIFPSGKAYHSIYYPTEKLISLASKTTCKDRWRQVINEADRLRDRNKYLLTLQQGISAAQLDEMEQEKVVLVVPKKYISLYPVSYQSRIWSVKKFIEYVKEVEAL